MAARGGTLRSNRSRCVNDPDAMQAARWKSAQLSVAKAIGFQVPPTVITNDLLSAREFAAAGRTVLKAASDAYARVGNQEITGSTVELANVPNEGDVTSSPVMLQRLVEKSADLRVTMVGERCFVVRVLTPQGSPIDVRQVQPEACRYQVLERRLTSGTYSCAIAHTGA